MADSLSLKAILSADGSQMSSTFSQIAGQVGGLQKTLMGGIGFGVMSAIGSKAVDLVAGGVRAMSSTVMDSGMSFEAAGSQIAATMGKSKSEITKIIDEASRLGATTSFTATQAAEGFNVLAMSGLKAEEQIAAMEPVLKLAAAGSYNLDSAASQVVGTIKGFGEGFDKAGYYADMFAKGATLASTDVNMLGVAMSDSAANAKSFGQESERTCIALLRLAEQGVTGSEAATALNRAMTDLYNATEPAQEKLKELGVSVYDDSGKARDFNTVVDELRDSMAGMTDDERNAAAGAIFSSYGLKAFNKMCVSSTEKVNEFADGLKNAAGSAAAQADEQLNNLRGDMTIFGSAMEGLGVTVFNKLSPSFRSIVQAATGMVSGIDNAIKNVKLEVFLAKAGKYVGAFVSSAKQAGEAFGTAFAAVGKALTKLNSKFGSRQGVNQFAAQCRNARDAFISFAGYIESHADQIAKLISILPKAAAAFVGFSMAGKVTPILQNVASAAGGLASVFAVKVPSSALTAGKSFTSFAGSFAGKVGKKITSASKSIGNGLLNITPPSVLGKISGGLDAVSGKFSGFGEMVKNKLMPPDSIGSVIAGKIKSIGGPVASTLANIGGKATSTVGTIISGLISTATKLLVPVAIIAALLAGMGLIYSAFGSQIDQILALAQTKGPEIIGGLTTAITTALPGLIASGAQMMAGLMNTITANLPAIISGGVAIIGSLAGGLASALPTLIPAAVNMIGTLVSGLLGAIPQVVSVGMQFLLALAQGIAANLPLILARAHEAVTNFIQGVITNLPTILSTATQIVTTLVQGIATSLPQLLSQGVELIGMVAQGIATNLPTILSSGAEIIGSLIAGIANAAVTLVTSIPTIMGQLVDAIMTTDWIKVGTDILTAIGEGLFGGMANIGGKIGSFFSNAKDWITGGKEGGTKTVTSAQEAVSAGSGAFTSAVGTMAQGGATAFSTNLATIGTTTTATMSTVTSSLSTVGTGMDAMSAAVSGGASNVSSALSTMGSDGGSAASGIESAMNTVSSAAQSGSANAVSAISSGGAKAQAAVTKSCQAIVRTMQSAATQAGAAGTQMGQRFAAGIRAGGAQAVSIAQSISQSAANAMRSGYSTAYSAGSYIGQGLAQGLASQAGSVAAQAAALANAANAAIAAKAKIGSPSKVTTQFGKWYGQGWINGISAKVSEAAKAARELVSVPEQVRGVHAAEYVGMAELDEQYAYSREQVIITKTYLDGREIARSEAPYRRSIDAREARKTGRRMRYAYG